MARLTNLEDALFLDKTGEYRDRLIEILMACTSTRNDELFYGKGSEWDAIQAACKVIETLWARYHEVPNASDGVATR
ncbi:hypothetical protein [Burkholderia ubonensis]|uniref:hypothetical protein n=1 Tax=Burkholderia ubonensis TaxID=101571 RepID=UPI000AE363C5|nr:hypothetical protein [Burkholderia ubonensis]